MLLCFFALPRTVSVCPVLLRGEGPRARSMCGSSARSDCDLLRAQIATMFAVMKATDYMQKPKFLANFWAGFKEVLGPKHVVRGLDKADFTPIYDWFMAEREKKKTLPKEARARRGGARALTLPKNRVGEGLWGMAVRSPARSRRAPPPRRLLRRRLCAVLQPGACLMAALAWACLRRYLNATSHPNPKRGAAASAQEKERVKKEKEAAEAKYKFALVDGRREQARRAPALCCNAAAPARGHACLACRQCSWWPEGCAPPSWSCACCAALS